MEVSFTKLSDLRHLVSVVRADGSTDEVELDSRSFLRHDLAHYAVELELGLRRAVWGSVAAGGSFDGEGLSGDEIALAESVAGPVQTLMRTEASVDEIRATLDRVVPDRSDSDLAERIHERLRQLRGHWKATGYGEAMVLRWPDDVE